MVQSLRSDLSAESVPATPAKFSFGLILVGAGFLVMMMAASLSAGGVKVSPMWLIVTYFLHTCGELCISPIGLSAITKLSPEQRVGQMMGIWFVGAALGNLFAGLVAGRLVDLPPSPLFQSVAMTVGVVGIIAVLASPFVKRPPS